MLPAVDIDDRFPIVVPAVFIFSIFNLTEYGEIIPSSTLAGANKIIEEIIALMRTSSKIVLSIVRTKSLISIVNTIDIAGEK